MRSADKVVYETADLGASEPERPSGVVHVEVH